MALSSSERICLLCLADLQDLGVEDAQVTDLARYR